METAHIRTGNKIYDTKGNLEYTGLVPGTENAETPRPSINAAKRESRRLQGSALGQGLVQVTK